MTVITVALGVLSYQTTLFEQADKLPTLIKTTSTALSPLAQKLYLRLCRSYIF